MDLRLAAFMIWGLGTVIVWGDVLRKRRRRLRQFHDVRARRDFLEGLGLFLVAFSSAVSIWMVLFGQAATGLRGLAIAVSLGAFFAVGLYARGEEDP
jgi:hypothetical protein